MTLDPALLRAVIEAPDDDLPRLLAADWLDEHGEGERAEFIRVQVELAKQPRRHVLAERAALTKHGPDYWECSGGVHIQGGMMLVTDANPGDRIDLPHQRPPLLGLRLVKFLEDTGERDSRGDAILARDAQSGPDTTDALRKRERELLEANAVNGRQWAWASLPRECHTYVYNWKVDFTRGFMSQFALSWQDWSRHAAELLRVAPIRGRPIRLKSWPPQKYVGGGVVRLTTWPQMEPLDGPRLLSELGERRVRLIGGTQEDTLPADEWPIGDFDQQTGSRTAPTLRQLLAAEWPGVRFELPQSGITIDLSALTREPVDPSADPTRYITPGTVWRTR